MARTFTTPRGSGAAPPRATSTSSTAAAAASAPGTPASAAAPGRRKQQDAVIVDLCDSSSDDEGGSDDGFDVSEIPTVERIVHLPANPARRAELLARRESPGLVFSKNGNTLPSVAGASSGAGATLSRTAAAAASGSTSAAATATASAASAKKAQVVPKFTPKQPKEKKQKKKATAGQKDNKVESAKTKAERKEMKKRKRSKEQEVGAGKPPKAEAAQKSSDPSGGSSKTKKQKITSLGSKTESSGRAPLEQQPKKPRKFGKMCKEMARYLRAVENGRGWLAMDPELAEWAHEQRVEYVKFVQQSQADSITTSTGSTTSSSKKKKKKRRRNQSKLNEEMIAKLRRIGFDPAEGGFGMSPPRRTDGSNTRISTDTTKNNNISSKSNGSTTSSARDNDVSIGDKSTANDSGNTNSSGPKRQLNTDPHGRPTVGAEHSSAASPVRGERNREEESRDCHDDETASPHQVVGLKRNSAAAHVERLRRITEKAKRRKKRKSGIALLPPKSDVGGEKNPIVLDDADDNDNHRLEKVGAGDKMENEPALRVYNDPGDPVCDIELADQDSEDGTHKEVGEGKGEEWCAFNYLPLVERFVIMDSKTNQPLPPEQQPPPRYSRQPLPMSPPKEKSKSKLADSQKQKKTRVQHPQQPRQAPKPREEARKEQQRKPPQMVESPKRVVRVHSAPDSPSEAAKVPCQSSSPDEQPMKPQPKSSMSTGHKPLAAPKSASEAAEASFQPSYIEMGRTSAVVNDEPSAKARNVDEDANVLPPAKTQNTDEANNEEPSISQGTEVRPASNNGANADIDSTDTRPERDDEVSKLKAQVDDLKAQLEEERRRRKQAERRKVKDNNIASGREDETGGTKKTETPSSKGKAAVEVIEIEDDDNDDEVEAENIDTSSRMASEPQAKPASTGFFANPSTRSTSSVFSAAEPPRSSDSGSATEQPAHPGAPSVMGGRSRAQEQAATKRCSVCKENHPEFRYSRELWHDSNGYCHKCMLRIQQETREHHWRAAAQWGRQPPSQHPQWYQRRTSTTPSSTKKKRPNKPQEDYLYSQREEQERLFREAADRLRQRQQRARQVPVGRGQACSGPVFQSPVDDVCSLPSNHWTWTDPFARLGLPRGSGIALIKKHFRKLALRYHPDKTMSVEASQAWHAVKESYEQLVTT